MPFDLNIKIKQLDFKKKEVEVEKTKKINDNGIYDKTFDNVNPDDIQ
jgi:hypothetical protein